MNFNYVDSVRPDNPYENAVFYKRWSFWWLKDLFKLGLQRPIETFDVYKIVRDHESSQLTDQFNELWEIERQKSRPSLLNVIRKIYGGQILMLSILYTAIDIVSRVIQSRCLGGLVTYFSQSEIDMQSHAFEINKRTAYWYSAGLILCPLVTTLYTHPFMLYALRVGMQIRVACTSMIYRKILKLRKSQSTEGLNGRVINFLSFDVVRFNNLMAFFHYLWKGPVEMIIFGYFIYQEIGYFGFIGVGFILCFVPIQISMGKMTANYRYRMSRKTDSRIRVMNEIIQGIQIIKMYAWEKPFAKIVDYMRKKELQTIRGVFVIRGILLSFNIISRFSIFLSLASYVYCGNVFTSRQVFVVTSYFNFLYDSMLHYWTISLTTNSECYVSVKRMEEFLLLPETKEATERKTKEQQQKRNRKTAKGEKFNVAFVPDVLANGAIAIDKYNQPSARKCVNIDEMSPIKCIQFKNVKAMWNNNDSQSGIDDINFNIAAGQFCAIIGPVGSGKSTILHTILRELEIDEGELIVNGIVSYSAQEPWLYEATIRQNILFTEMYNETRYKQVIRVCALERDLQLLPYGDYTIIGERGISLSGGQRARINLARAIYRKADIYLLDDPLSAVDTLVGKHIFDNCIKDFLSDKICLLVTHQEQYLSASNHVILMNCGRIEIQGKYANIKNTHYNSLKRLSSTTDKETNKFDDAIEMQEEISTKSKEEFTVQLESRKESQHIGSVGTKVYKAYAKSVDNIILVVTVMTFIIIGQIAISSIDLFVSKWVNWETDLGNLNAFLNKNAVRTNISVRTLSRNTIQRDRLKYVYFYTALMLVVLYLVFQRALTLFYFCLKASRRIHDKLFNGVIRAKMYFFNTNASGRIINRFSKDITDIDFVLPIVLYDSILFFLQFAAIMILVSITNNWLLIPTIVISLIFYGLRHIYINTARCLKRIESLGRSPIFNHMNATISGLSTIRAHKSDRVVSAEFDALQNDNTSAYFLFTAASRALALWLEIICVLYMMSVIAIFLIFDKVIIGGNVGLAITQILNLILMSQWGMRQTAELENTMTSVERVMEYIDLDAEEPETEEMFDEKIVVNWPTNGAIEFTNLSMRYSKLSDRILKSLNLRINSCEKVGIVGRTGAGKSSIIQAIFRLAQNDGIIRIDGVDISKIPLYNLRKNISIIPQDPILFSGTMRDNLDPFHEKCDDELWNALEQVELRSIVSALPNGLDCKIYDNGSNFSMGQRQLVCLARAILRNNKILILDEATANVDVSTDKFIQKTIREKFANCTVLTIAHRLHTVMESDRVLVIDAGEAVEFDHAHCLLQYPNGFLTKLVDETGFSTAQQLKQMAKQCFDKKS